MSEPMRICGDCQFFHFDEASPGYSELTPGNEFAMMCMKNHWEFDTWSATLAQLKRVFTAALDCPDYLRRE